MKLRKTGPLHIKYHRAFVGDRGVRGPKMKDRIRLF